MAGKADGVVVSGDYCAGDDWSYEVCSGGCSVFYMTVQAFGSHIYRSCGIRFRDGAKGSVVGGI